MKVKHDAFKFRAFATLMMAFCAIGLVITGIANHAYGFGPMSMGRHFWMTAHNVLGLLFISAAVWHGLLNRRLVLSHLRGPVAFSREAKIACLVVGLVLLLFAAHVLHT